MIVVRLVGGLGNQMFQYAGARHLAEINDASLKIDLSEYESCGLRQYSLQHFNIVEEFASGKDLDSIKLTKEKHFHFDKDFKSIGDNVLLTGYWQCEKYFIEISNIIHAEFIVKAEVSGKNLEISKRINTSNSVSLHIRRTDYVAESYKDQIFDNLSLEYYQRAVEDLSKTQDDIKLFVFSDDPEWVRDNVEFELPIEYVAHNTAETSYEDLRLMSLCRHNIIANSSFSWWGAWLNRDQHKRVYAPREWFNSNVRNLDSKDVIPEAWVKI